MHVARASTVYKVSWSEEGVMVVRASPRPLPHASQNTRRTHARRGVQLLNGGTRGTRTRLSADARTRARHTTETDRHDDAQHPTDERMMIDTRAYFYPSRGSSSDNRHGNVLYSYRGRRIQTTACAIDRSMTRARPHIRASVWS